jgi:hypothetical protein
MSSGHYMRLLAMAVLSFFSIKAVGAAWVVRPRCPQLALAKSQESTLLP